MSELKPCPFCGGEAAVIRTSHETWISCDNYHYEKHLVSVCAKTEAEAIEAWNNRAEPTCDGCVWWSPHEPISWTCLACSRHYKDNYETRATDGD